jgi:hypothetical protein
VRCVRPSDFEVALALEDHELFVLAPSGKRVGVTRGTVDDLEVFESTPGWGLIGSASENGGCAVVALVGEVYVILSRAFWGRQTGVKLYSACFCCAHSAPLAPLRTRCAIDFDHPAETSFFSEYLLG